MILPPIHPVVIRAADPVLPITPIAESVASGAPRCAYVEHTPHSAHGEVDGRAWMRGAPDLPTQGWPGVGHALLLQNTYADTSALWMDLISLEYYHLLLPRHRPEEEPDLTVLLTRDAIGWLHTPTGGPLLGDGADVGLPAGERYWPMLWIRPLASAHERLGRISRLTADLALAHAVLADHLPQGCVPTPVCL